ncbi:hypothetical protein IV203_030898 [Nitzschia inconspicua]|uniref:Uncharacterized protein n=1 Tax=Nitzschia inconspicua TaxID=303405 RepID=A0A9K3Q2M0_9STRA|nr:hypothetical protein IV203_030898 [Nitzschia inconspicua]
MDKQLPPNTANFRYHHRTKELKVYIMQKTQLSEDTFSDINGQSHERSFNTFKYGPHIFLVKFLHGWLRVGKLVPRYNPVKYPSACPSCDEPSRDSKHYPTCLNPEHRKWHAALKTSLWHRCGSVVLLDLLLWGLNHWLQGTPIPAHRVPKRIAHPLHSQTMIGWDNFLLGRLQLQYLQRNLIEVKIKHGLSWSSNISSHTQTQSVANGMWPLRHPFGTDASQWIPIKPFLTSSCGALTIGSKVHQSQPTEYPSGSPTYSTVRLR